MLSHIPMLVRIVLFISFFLLISCSSKSKVVIDSSHISDVEDDYSEMTTRYPLYVGDITDKRKDKDSLGTLGLTDVSSNDILKWLSKAFVSRGYKLNIDDKKLAEGQETQACVVDIGLKLAYIRSSSTSKATNIVLSTYIKQAETSKYYRGTDTGMNWISSESEIISSFTLALKDALDTMESDMPNHCPKN